MTRTELVDCGSCTACCRRELITLVEGDRLDDYPEAVELDAEGKRRVSSILPTSLGWAIPHGDDGACVYLKAGACSIYNRRPVMCRAFSCVGWVKHVLETTTRTERRRSRVFFTEVWREGKKRLAGAAS